MRKYGYSFFCLLAFGYGLLAQDTVSNISASGVDTLSQEFQRYFEFDSLHPKNEELRIGTTSEWLEQEARDSLSNVEQKQDTSSLELSREIPKDSIPPRILFFLFQDKKVGVETLRPVVDELSRVHQDDDLWLYERGLYQTLSTQGGVHQPLFIPYMEGLDRKFSPDLFSVYAFSKKNIRFFQTNRPYTLLNHTGGTQVTQNIRVIHSQNLRKGWNAALEYKVRYSDGEYMSSGTGNHYFNLTSNYLSREGRYRILFAFIRDHISSEESGGLQFDSVFLQRTIGRTDAMSVNLSTASTACKNMELFCNQEYNLNKVAEKEDIGSFLNKGIIAHRISYVSGERIFRDDKPSPSFYPNQYNGTNKTFDSMDYKKMENVIMWSNDAFIPNYYQNPLKLSIGVKHELFSFWDEHKEHKGNRLLPFANIDLEASFLRLSLLGEVVKSTDYTHQDRLLKGCLDFPRSKILSNLRLMFDWAYISPDFHLHHFYSSHFRWDNDWEKTRRLRTGVAFDLPSSITVGVDVHQVKGQVYLGDSIKPVLHAANESMLQAYVSHRFTFGAFGAEGSLNFRKASSSEVFRLPTVDARQTITFNFYTFGKKMKTQIGADLYYLSSYYADAYMPALGAFYRQNTTEIGNYVYADFFVAAQVKKVQFFLKVNHFYAGLFGRHYFNTPHYPHSGFAVRWGFSWVFFD